MSAQQIAEIISDLILVDDITLQNRLGKQGLATAHEIEGIVRSHLMEKPAYAPFWQEFKNTPSVLKPVLVGILEVMSQTDSELAQLLEVLLTEYNNAVISNRGRMSVSTGGGAVIGGSVSYDSITVTGDANIIGDGNIVSIAKQTDAVEKPHNQNYEIDVFGLFKILVNRFTRYELHELSFLLNIDSDELPGIGISAQAKGLLELLSRQGRLHELVQLGQEIRPDILWKEIAQPKTDP